MASYPCSSSFLPRMSREMKHLVSSWREGFPQAVRLETLAQSSLRLMQGKAWLLTLLLLIGDGEHICSYRWVGREPLGAVCANSCFCGLRSNPMTLSSLQNPSELVPALLSYCCAAARGAGVWFVMYFKTKDTVFSNIRCQRWHSESLILWIAVRPCVFLL